MFKNYIDYLFKNKIIFNLQKKVKSGLHNVLTDQVNKIVLSSNDDKSIQTFDKIATYLQQ